ncbi:MAG: beta-ketoacyl synthase chain length factor, partial [Gillisia sp.]
MKNNIYINGIGSISAQAPEVPFSQDPMRFSENIFPAMNQEYKKYIPAMQLRRMSSIVKMGVTAAKMALNEAGAENPSAIITATGEGSKQDTEKFLEMVLSQHEKMLSPTAFIQSTHNTLGGQIALHFGCTAYNLTYTHGSCSLEWALLDGMLNFSEKDSGVVLVGGADEISPTISSFSYLNNRLKENQISNLDLFQRKTPGTIASEGAHFFALSSEKTPHSYARLLDVEIFQADSDTEVDEKIQHFLNKNHLGTEEIEMLLLGKNGDSRFDHFYEFLQEGTFK